MAKSIEISNDNGGFKEGDPYFCPECERNHVKGKIYKEHLKYFLTNEAGEKEVDDDEVENEADIDVSDEEEFLESLDDDDLEYIDDIDALIEEEENLDADDDDLFAEDEEMEEQIQQDIEDSINAVKSLKGVGETTMRKLTKSGFCSLESIAYTPQSLIKEASGLGDKTVAKLVKGAMNKLQMGFKSADLIWEKRRNIARITSGSPELDDLLGGGVETGSLIEFFGEFRTGKTQIMHQLCVNVQLSKEKGGIKGRALYIDTEGTFRPERIIQMANALDLDYNEVLQNIVYGRAYTSDHQILMVKDAANIIKEKNIKLIVVDSLIGHFRNEYIGRGTLAGRQQTLNQHLHDLLRLCDIHPDLAIIVTNQVQSKPDCFYGNPIKAAGGNIIAHGSTIRVFLRKGKGEQRVAKIIDAPNLPEGEAVFSITEDGIRE